MKKLLCILIIIILCGNCFAQNDSGHLKYKVILKKDVDRNPEELKFATLEKEFERVAVQLTFELIYDKEGAVFGLEDNLKIDENEMYVTMARTILGGNSVFYTKPREQEFIEEKTFLGEKFFIKRPFEDMDWKITEESKMINGFTGYKATANRIGQDRNFEPTSVPITAWFVPEISIPFGPFESAGLPGLVLEFSVSDYTFRVSEMEFHKIEKIDFPDTEKVITREEFEEKIKNYAKRNRL